MLPGLDSVLVTGGFGKVGSYFLELLQQTHGTASVQVMGRSVPRANPHGFPFELVDLLDASSVRRVARGVSTIVHLASVPTNGVVPPARTLLDNVAGAYNLYDAAVECGVRRVVLLSSEAVLGYAPNAAVREINPDYFPLDEDHPLRPQDSYGLSKVAVEEIAGWAWNRGAVETVALRAPWVVSPDELKSLAMTRGVRPETFGLFHYIDARDLARAIVCAMAAKVRGCIPVFVGAGESTVTEPLGTLLPRLRPSLGDLAAKLTGHQSSVSVERGKELLVWRPVHSWRTPETL